MPASFSYILLAKHLYASLDESYRIFRNLFREDSSQALKIEHDVRTEITAFQATNFSGISSYAMKGFTDYVTSNTQNVFAFYNTDGTTSPNYFFLKVVQKPENHDELKTVLSNRIQLEAFGFKNYGYQVGDFADNYLLINYYHQIDTQAKIQERIKSLLEGNKIVLGKESE